MNGISQNSNYSLLSYLKIEVKKTYLTKDECLFKLPGGECSYEAIWAIIVLTACFVAY